MVLVLDTPVSMVLAMLVWVFSPPRRRLLTRRLLPRSRLLLLLLPLLPMPMDMLVWVPTLVSTTTARDQLMLRLRLTPLSSTPPPMVDTVWDTLDLDMLDLDMLDSDMLDLDMPDLDMLVWDMDMLDILTTVRSNTTPG